VVDTICAVLDEIRPGDAVTPHKKLITFVKDRPGHDRRYAIDISKIQGELGWQPKETFKSGIRKTICWYLENQAWIQNVTSGAYRQWMATQYSL
jgi:dTDP-glucose 4,6-dehydratase